MSKRPEIPTSGGTYVIKDGKLQQVHATRQAPAVHVETEQPAEAPRPPAPAAKKE